MSAMMAWMAWLGSNPRMDCAVMHDEDGQQVDVGRHRLEGARFRWGWQQMLCTMVCALNMNIMCKVTRWYMDNVVVW